MGFRRIGELSCWAHVYVDYEVTALELDGYVSGLNLGKYCMFLPL